VRPKWWYCSLPRDGDAKTLCGDPTVGARPRSGPEIKDGRSSGSDSLCHDHKASFNLLPTKRKIIHPEAPETHICIIGLISFSIVLHLNIISATSLLLRSISDPDLEVAPVCTCSFVRENTSTRRQCSAFSVFKLSPITISLTTQMWKQSHWVSCSWKQKANLPACSSH